VDGGAPSDAGPSQGNVEGGAFFDASLPPLPHFDASSASGPIDKVDILFDIDNSASMGDKQAYLVRAIPDLVDRLVNPPCIDSAGHTLVKSQAGECSAGAVAYLPVRDLHLGVVTSSLGARLSPAVNGVCNPTASPPSPFSNLSAHDDDQGHLIARSLTYATGGGAATEGTVADAFRGFLSWAPGTDAAATGSVTDTATLEDDLGAIVSGAGVYGCGIESQLESWYRFLIQPDPYASLSLDSAGHAQWTGVDAVVLQQRHDFLRPDSLVVIVDLTDENDSEIDVRSFGGQGYLFMDPTFKLPRGTSACGADPADPGCLSCGVAGTAADGGVDPSCALGPYTAQNDWGFDINLRHVHMKAKYGLDPQYPVQRYSLGLSSATVPDRAGEYPPGATSYVGALDCTNPLFAAQLPDGTATDAATLCALPVGPRTPDLVFYTHIGGVPSQLLHFDPNDSAASELTDADWTAIVGRDPLGFDTTGIDPHMIESYAPRPGLPLVGGDAGDPISGGEWITDQQVTAFSHGDFVDLEYACTFPLAAPRDCALAANVDDCDCPAAPGGLTAEELPPVCDPKTQTLQTGAKAYPTIREILVAKLLGEQGIVSSICPIHPEDNATGDDPLFGYRPAIARILDRLEPKLTPPR
jgi:hypothetical protein